MPQDTNHNSSRNHLSPVATALRIEGLALAVACVICYAQAEGAWGLFATLILAPDLAMLGYALGRRAGTFCYNLAHSTALPLVLGLFALFTQSALPLQLALIWGAHIGLDRAIGYGLKYATGFKDTHLARV